MLNKFPQRLIFIFIALFSGYSSLAQLPDGAVAPDFTYTDIEGNTHTLSDYLAQGKWVFLDIFAVWCNNCVNQIPNVEASYAAYGPEGDNSTVFLALEIDPDTEDDMQHPIGTESYDWLNAFDYPIINDTEDFTTLYSTTFQPAFYLIRPDGISYFVYPPTPANLQEVFDTYQPGCMDNTGCNYDSNANVDDGSCDFLSCYGCTDSGACNYDSSSTMNDGSCDFVTCVGCMNPMGCNYDSTATQAGTCDLETCYGCTAAAATNYDSTATFNDGSCIFTTDVNMDSVVNVTDLLLFLAVFGCEADCPLGDFDSSGSVDTTDLLQLLSEIGQGT